jgi:hypothetical protein
MATAYFDGDDVPEPLSSSPPLMLLLPPLGLPLLLSLGGLGLLLGGGVPDVDGGADGVFGFVGVDCVGQFALVSITDPSGHFLVVGDGGVVVDGVNVCVHDGSFGVFVQSTGGGVPVQLFTHVDPAPDFPDAGIDVLLGCIAADANDFVVLT